MLSQTPVQSHAVYTVVCGVQVCGESDEGLNTKALTFSTRTVTKYDSVLLLQNTQ